MKVIIIVIVSIVLVKVLNGENEFYVYAKILNALIFKKEFISIFFIYFGSLCTSIFYIIFQYNSLNNFKFNFLQIYFLHGLFPI